MKIYKNHRPIVKSTELAHNSDLNTTIPASPNLNTPLPRLQRQISVQLNI